MVANWIHRKRLRSRLQLLIPKKGWKLLLSSCFLGALLVVMALAPSQAKPPENLPVLKTIEQIAPSDLQNLLEATPSDISTAPVSLSGQALFKVAAAAQSEEADSDLTAEQRAEQIETRLQRIAQQIAVGSNDPAVSWSIEANGRQPIIYVNDQFLMTVTSLDAQIESHNSLKVRANQLERIIQEALDRYAKERRPSYFWRQSRTVALILLGLAALHLGLRYGRKRLARRKWAIDEVVAGDQASQFTETEIAIALRDQCRARETKGWLDFQKALIVLAQFGAWFGGIYYILGLFPQSRSLQPMFLDILRLPVRIAVIALCAYWLLRLVYRLIDRLFLTIQDSSAITGETTQRLGLRFSTFSQVSKSVAAFVLLIVAGIVGLASLGVQVGPLLTGAGLVGLAFSLASQNLIQDFINGFLILMEDQYGVGDVIVVDNVGGFVEMMNLRITQLRNEEGRLITIPNSRIGVVQNLSKEWSRVDLMVPVALDADINQALEIVQHEADALRHDATWGQLILEPPLLLGVDHLDHGGATIRIWIKTFPLKQWDVGREYRRRLKIAFEQAHISIGVPQQIVHVSGPSGNGENGYSPISSKQRNGVG